MQICGDVAFLPSSTAVFMFWVFLLLGSLILTVYTLYPKYFLRHHIDVQFLSNAVHISCVYNTFHVFAGTILTSAIVFSRRTLKWLFSYILLLLYLNPRCALIVNSVTICFYYYHLKKQAMMIPGWLKNQKILIRRTIGKQSQIT